jgi:uncharacterized damage-inducible protein DinB
VSASYLSGLIEYNNWANFGLIDFVGTQPPETLDLTAAGVYGSVRDTLAHVLTGERSYHRHLAGLPRVDRAADPERPDLAWLRQLASESAANLTSLLSTLPDAATMLHTRDGHRAAATVMTQLVMHGCEHRAHIGTTLGAHGIVGPELDGWSFGILVSGDDWPSDLGQEPAARPRYPSPEQR